MPRRRPKGEGSIHRRADGKWVGRFYYEDPLTGLARRAGVTGATKKDVSAQLRTMGVRGEGGSPARDDTALFGVFAARWLESSLPASGRKEATQVLYAGLTRNHIIGSELGRLSMRNMRPSSVERCVIQLRAKNLSESTVRQIYTVARAIGDDAVRDGRMARNPFAVVRRPRVSSVEAQFLEPSQVRLLLETAHDSRYGMFFEFLVHTGLRRGEALALTWSDVDLEERLVRVRGTLARLNGELRISDPKSAKSRRTVPLSEPAVDVLRRIVERTRFERVQAAQLWVDSGHVFITDVGEPAMRLAQRAPGPDHGCPTGRPAESGAAHPEALGGIRDALRGCSSERGFSAPRPLRDLHHPRRLRPHRSRGVRERPGHPRRCPHQPLRDRAGRRPGASGNS